MKFVLLQRDSVILPGLSGPNLVFELGFPLEVREKPQPSPEGTSWGRLGLRLNACYSKARPPVVRWLDGCCSGGGSPQWSTIPHLSWSDIFVKYNKNLLLEKNEIQNKVTPNITTKLYCSLSNHEIMLATCPSGFRMLSLCFCLLWC
jgi:hypothetical protein